MYRYGALLTRCVDSVSRASRHESCPRSALNGQCGPVALRGTSHLVLCAAHVAELGADLRERGTFRIQRLVQPEVHRISVHFYTL